MLGVPYLGSDPLTLALCLDKSRAKEILAHHGIATASFAVIRSDDELRTLLSASSRRDAASSIGFTFGQRHSAVPFPAIVKPVHEGSSKGIYNSSVVRSLEELEREVLTVIETYREPALVEEYLPGREFTVGVLGNGSSSRTLPIVEIKFDALPPGVNHIYSYEAKWIWDRAEDPLKIFECPAILESSLEEKIIRISLDAYRVLNCRDWARVDIRLDARHEPHVLELNPLPGILPRPEDNSCLPKAARAAGLSYAELINTVLDIAMTRCGIPVVVPQPHLAEMAQ
jgi:D-alanine-D-alanine ligase